MSAQDTALARAAHAALGMLRLDAFEGVAPDHFAVLLIVNPAADESNGAFAATQPATLAELRAHFEAAIAAIDKEMANG
jgi:hypothetical protein